MAKISVARLLFVLLGLAAHAMAFFIIGCGKPIVVERIDPILQPGGPSGHLHTIMGGNAIDYIMNYGTTQTSTCTTCAVSKDLSNYWTPNLFFHAPNGSFISVEQVGGLSAYYQQRIDWTEKENQNKKIHAFPKGFRMVAGNSASRSYSDTVEHQAIEFNCFQENNGPDLGMFHQLPHHQCDGGLRTTIHFPYCWDGVNLDSPDHKSHVVYPSRMNTGPCPDTHPVVLISLFYELTFSVKPFNSLRTDVDQPFVFSNGDPTGYGLHADFINGWDVDLLQAAIDDDSCGNTANGRLELCKPLLPYMLSPDQQNSCPTKARRVEEPVSGVLDALPGCNPVQYGPADATQKTC